MKWKTIFLVLATAAVSALVTASGFTALFWKKEMRK